MKTKLLLITLCLLGFLYLQFGRAPYVNLATTQNTTDGYVLPWLDAVERIAPREVMIYTIDRETPVQGLQKASPEELDGIVARLRERGIKASASY